MQIVDGMGANEKETKEKYAKTDIWARFLESKEFKALKWTPKTANDFFMVGYVMNCATRHAENKVKEFATKQVVELLGKLPGVHIEIVGGKG